MVTGKHEAPGPPGPVALSESAEFFTEVYLADEAPWDIGRPQAAVIGLAEEGLIRGSVLDVGCGTGENAIYLAELGHEVWAIDYAAPAVAEARAKAEARGVVVTLGVAAALRLERLGRAFDTVIDSGFFHTLSNRERRRFAASLRRALNEGGLYHLLCFSELEPGGEGPRRVTQAEIRDTFRRGFEVRRIHAARFESRLSREGARAWLALIERCSFGTNGVSA